MDTMGMAIVGGFQPISKIITVVNLGSFRQNRDESGMNIEKIETTT